LNRQTKRMMQRQGQLGPDGTPESAERPVRQPPARAQAARTTGAPPRPPLTTRVVSGVKDVRGELRKVAWGTRDEVVNYTTIVLVTLVILVSFVFLLNLGFSRAIKALFGL
jgi:preprotein translocase subunit SecE